MTLPIDESRRRLLQRLTLGAVLVSLSSVASGAAGRGRASRQH
jgi:hypothetical protein